jgi:hypothetical protein
LDDRRERHRPVCRGQRHQSVLRVSRRRAARRRIHEDTPTYQLYQRVAPRPEDFPRLLDKIGELMAQGYDHTEAIRSLQVPTLIVAADADMALRATTSKS